MGRRRQEQAVLAPRHPERWPAVAELVRREGLALERRSAAAEAGESAPSAGRPSAGRPSAGRPSAGHPSAGRPEVFLLDSLGELAALYRVAAAAYIGGTLVPTGGHNPLEPAHFAVPVVVGPSMENFRQMAADFEAARAWQRVEDARGLADTLDGWLSDPAAAREVGERARRLLTESRGALGRTLELLAPLVAAVEKRSPSS